MVLGFAKLHFIDTKLGLDDWQTGMWLAPIADGSDDASWEDSVEEPFLKDKLMGAPCENAEFADVPGKALREASYSAWAKSLQSHLYETARTRVMWSDAFKAASKPNEDEGTFRTRLTLAAREKRDAAVAELRKRWQTKLQQLQDQIRRGEERRERESSQLSQQKINTALSIGSSILGALLGRKAMSATNVGRVGSAARSASRIGRESQDVTRAEESLEVLQQRLEDTKREVDAEVARLETTLDASTISLRAVEVPARKSDIAVGEIALVWTPWRKGADGFPAPAYD
jgi:ferritin-like metal-binding protein YciE